jgi:alpha-ribazole phosphatase
MLKMTRLILIRHTTTLLEPGRCYGGGSELPVAESFEQEAAALVPLLPLQVDVCQVSPLNRCRALALRLLPAAEWRSDPRLAEIHFGAWEGQRWEDLAGPVLDGWMADFVGTAPPNGESALDLLTRVQSWLDSVADGPNSTHLAVTHGGVIRAAVCAAIGLPLAQMFQLEIPCGCLVELTFRQGQWRLEKILPPHLPNANQSPSSVSTTTTNATTSSHH